MVTIIVHCPHCQSEALVRNGHAPNGKQLYRCRCAGSFGHPFEKIGYAGYLVYLFEDDEKKGRTEGP